MNIFEIFYEPLKQKMQRDIASIFENYFSLPLTIICIIILALLVFYLHKKYKLVYFQKYLKISLILMLFLAGFASVLTMKIYWILKSEPATFSVGILNFYIVDEGGKLKITKEGIKIKRSIYETLLDLKKKECKLFSKIADPQFILLEQSTFAFSHLSPLNIQESFKDYTISKRANIIIWGYISDNGSIEEIKIFNKPNLFDEKNILAIATQDFIKKFEKLILESIKGVDISCQGEVVARFLYSFISQMPSVSIGAFSGDSIIGLKILDESKKVFTDTTKLIRITRKNMQLISWHEIIYDLNAAEVLRQAGKTDEAIEKVYKALTKNIYFPFDSSEIFKEKYNRYYAFSIAKKAAEIGEINQTSEREKKIALRLKLFKYDDEMFLFEMFNQYILESQSYHKNLEYYSKLAEQFPNSAIVYIFWGDAIKYYGSKAFKLNLDRVDAAIEKYQIAEKKDSWALIGLKIYAISLLQMIQEQERGNIKKAQTISKFKDSYKEKQIKFLESIEIKEYFEK